MRTIRSGEPGYEVARVGFAARHDDVPELPRVVLFPESIDQVASALRGADAGYSIRSGGHDYEGSSSRTRGDLIDLSRLDEFSLEGDVATLGPGLTMRVLNERLAATGLTLPMATGATVGLGGYLLGGGLGLTSRRHGLASDALRAATLVTPQGEVVEIDEARHPDLFWALRGGGNARFGAVVRFQVRLHPVGRVALIRATWPWERAREVLERYTRVGPDLDAGLTTALTLRADRVVEMVGVYTPALGESVHQAREHVAPLTDRARGGRLSMAAAQRVAFGGFPFASRWALTIPARRQLFKATSAFAHGSFPPQACDEIVRNLESFPKQRGTPSQPPMVRVLAGGGALASGPGCTFHRCARLLFQYDAYWSHPEDEAPATAWASHLRRSLLPWTSGAYAGYQDAELETHEYYGEDFPHLQRVLTGFR